MDAYIDIVSAEIRSLELPEPETDLGKDHDNTNNKKVNRPLPIAVAIMCAIASCTLASCWIAVTADVNKMLTAYGPHSMLFMQLAYNGPVLPIVVFQKKFGPFICRSIGTKSFVVIQALIAYVGLGYICTKWDYIMRELTEGIWERWFFLWVIVGVCSATGYGAFLFLVRLFDNGSKSFFVIGFNCASFINLIILLSTGGPMFAMKRSDVDTDFDYYQTIGGFIWFGLFVVVVTILCIPQISERMKEHDMEVSMSSLLYQTDDSTSTAHDEGLNKLPTTSNLEMRWQNSPAAKGKQTNDHHDKAYEQSSPHEYDEQSNNRLNSTANSSTLSSSSSPLSSGDINRGLKPHDLTLQRTLAEYALWPLAWQTMVSFICSITTFTLISYVPSKDCFLPLKLTYVSMFCDVLGQYIPLPCGVLLSSTNHHGEKTPPSSTATSAVVGSILGLRLVLLVIFYVLCAMPISEAFSGEDTDITACVIVASTAALGSMLSRFNFARTADACSHGYQVAPTFCKSMVTPHDNNDGVGNGGGSGVGESKSNERSPPQDNQQDDEVGGDGGYAVRQGISAVSFFVFLGCYIGYCLVMLLIYLSLKRGWHYNEYDHPGQHDGYPSWFKPTCSTRETIREAWCVPDYLMVGCDGK